MQSSFILFYDYYYLWAAGRLVLEGGNPYDLVQFTEMVYSTGWPQSELIWGFTHPPWIFWVYVPFALLSFKLACISWLLFLLLLVLFLTHLCKQLASTSSDFTALLPTPLLLLSIISFPPTLKNLIFGQVSLLMACGFFFGILLMQRNRLFLAGLSLSLVLLKPHILLPVLIALCVRAISQRQWLLFVGGALGFSSQLAMALFWYPESFSDYFHYIPNLVASSPNLSGATLSQIASSQFDIYFLRIPLVILGAGTGLFFGFRSQIPLTRVLHILIPISLLVSPYGFSHEMVYLIPSYLLLIGVLYEKVGEQTRYACVGVAGIGIIMLARIQLEYLSILIPLILLAFTLYSKESSSESTAQNL